jgi:hypothetical protein
MTGYAEAQARSGRTNSEQTVRKIFGTKTRLLKFLWGADGDEHEEATYFDRGSGSCYVFRYVSGSRRQQAQGVGGCPGFMQSSSR